jgi:murein DD-endopeptidase MepM/ murein hydrolase activator NlpD
MDFNHSKLNETRGASRSFGARRSLLSVLLVIFIIFGTADGICLAFNEEIDYDAMRTDPIEDAFKKLTENEIPEWDEGYVKGGEIKDMLVEMAWPLKTGYLRGLFNRRAGKGRRRHDGIDLIAPKGTPIYAALDGVVEIVSSGSGMFRGYGKVVFINHDNRIWSLYSHCDTITVKMGQRVKQGDKIATVGRTGRATTNHLHFEIRNKSGTPMDPLRYLPKEGALPRR